MKKSSFFFSAIFILTLVFVALYMRPSLNKPSIKGISVDENTMNEMENQDARLDTPSTLLESLGTDLEIGVLNIYDATFQWKKDSSIINVRGSAILKEDTITSNLDIISSFFDNRQFIQNSDNFYKTDQAQNIAYEKDRLVCILRTINSLTNTELINLEVRCGELIAVY